MIILKETAFSGLVQFIFSETHSENGTISVPFSVTNRIFIHLFNVYILNKYYSQ
jgi:hypothetical protein